MPSLIGSHPYFPRSWPFAGSVFPCRSKTPRVRTRVRNERSQSYWRSIIYLSFASNVKHRCPSTCRQKGSSWLEYPSAQRFRWAFLAEPMHLDSIWRNFYRTNEHASAVLKGKITMKLANATCLMLMTALVSTAIVGCNNPPPEVVTAPGTTTVVHDKSAPPTVVVNPPAPPPNSTHTETHTDTKTPSDTAPSSSSTTTTTGN